MTETFKINVCFDEEVEDLEKLISLFLINTLEKRNLKF